MGSVLGVALPAIRESYGAGAQEVWPGMTYGGNTSYSEAWGAKGTKISVDGDSMIVEGDRIRVLAQRNPAELPWSALMQFDVEFDRAVAAGDRAQNALFATALDDFTADNGATVQGRLLAQTGAVTLDHNVIDVPTLPPTLTGGTLK